MKNSFYLSADIVIAINHQVIELNGVPDQIATIKDANALNALITLPKQQAFDQELYPSIAAKGTSLFVKIIKKHVFADGNKRTAVIALLLFLRKNGFTLNVSQQQLADYTLSIAQTDDNRLDYHEITQWLNAHISKLKNDSKE
ncbi:type II toxin-antitoxin system death-on-curing family toxin [Paucilactobacillus wasatchensis]|uniref:Death on curing protein, Doc toxin n=1 Tax=Paucilactobacillus wasatchensis TaxID=1335616 RepID=A0A0D1A6A8_9LACO|nr:type II toxin-antitoxin system death-on-curing family toxin [Paucilactobacillus wasatchensis]KIS03202.1 Death on curing protein, Doc toxin [Paucilactobacillus wasatchensis]